MRLKKLTPDEIFEKLSDYSSGDLDPKSGRMWGHSYNTGIDELEEIAKKAFLMFMDKTMLDFTTYPSLLKMENDIVAMLASLLNGDEQVAGNFTFGGTESIFLAMKAAKEISRRKGVSSLEALLPATAHPAFYKAGEYLGIRCVTFSVDPETFKADVDALNEKLNANTAFIAASAPNYPFGVVDDVSSMAEIALDHDVWLHVDSCIGGFVLPFFKKLGEYVPDFDFTVKGVSSISLDLHKYGYAPRGGSVILHRRREHRVNHIFVKASWPGYPLVNTTVLSTRSAGSLAASWAVLHYLGEEGYLKLSEKILAVKRKLLKSLPEIGFKILGNPESSLLAFTSDDVNVFDIAEEMKKKGWYIQAQPGSRFLGFPKSIHLTISPNHDKVVDEFIADLTESLKKAEAGGERGLTLLEEIAKSGSGGFDEILDRIGLRAGELPEDMRLINELIHAMPPEVVEEVFRMAVNDYLFRLSGE